MTAIEIFQKNHRTNRKALVSLDRALLMQGGNWSIAAKNLANYLDIELREYWGSEERWIFRPLAEERLGIGHLEQVADRVLLLKEIEQGLEEPAAID